MRVTSRVPPAGSGVRRQVHVLSGRSVGWGRWTQTIHRVVNPWLLDRGLAGGEHSEIGPLEHVGRRSGIVRLTPVHPEPTSASSSR